MSITATGNNPVNILVDDTATTTLVTMGAQVKPAAITMNPSGNYLFNGNGSLLAGTLTANSGSLIIANTIAIAFRLSEPGDRKRV